MELGPSDGYLEVVPRATGYRVYVTGGVPGRTYTSLHDVWENYAGGIYQSYYPVYADFTAAVAAAYPGMSEAEVVEQVNSGVGLEPGPVTLTIRFGDVVLPNEEYPAGEFSEVEATENWDSFSLGVLANDSGVMSVPGWGAPPPYGTAEKPPLSMPWTTARVTEVTGYRAHSGSKSVRHAGGDLGWDLEQIDGPGWSLEGNPIVEASCWHYRNSSYVALSDWHINLNGGGGLNGLGSPGALDWYFTVNGNGRPAGSFLNAGEFAMNNVHFFHEVVVNQPWNPANVWEDTGVYAWDRWLKQRCLFDAYLNIMRWELSDASGLLWSKELTPDMFPGGLTNSTTSFEFDFLEGDSDPLPESGYPDWIDDLYARSSKWLSTYTFPTPVIEAKRDLVRRRFE